MRTMPLEPDRLRLAPVTGRAVGVDRKNRVILGYVVAEAGAFKTPGRGAFDADSLATIARLMSADEPLGTKSRFTHPSMSDDGLGKFLGRARNARVDGPRVRADLHLDDSASTTPSGDLAGYVMDRAESDPDSLGSSLVLLADKSYDLDANGQRKMDADGRELPPLWRPTRIYASDLVDDGDAVHGGLLSAGLEVDGLPLSALWHGAAMLDQVFEGQSREVVDARCRAFLSRYLAHRFGEPGGVATDGLRRRLSLREKDVLTFAQR